MQDQSAQYVQEANMKNQLLLYFQKQTKFSSQCGVHALNNLLGLQCYSEKQLNQICSQLSNSIINPHKHFLGGDFDANVMMIALQNVGLNTKWIDNRKQIFIDKSQQKKIVKFGYLVNCQLKKSFYHNILKLSARHWFVIRYIDNHYYMLDSLKQAPQMINDVQLLLNQMRKNGSQIIQVTKKEKQ